MRTGRRFLGGAATGLMALAALLSGKLSLDGRTAVVVASGGNIDPEIFARAITAAPIPDRPAPTMRTSWWVVILARAPG